MIETKTVGEILDKVLYTHRHEKLNECVQQIIEAMELYAQQQTAGLREQNEALAESYSKLQVLYGERTTEVNELKQQTEELRKEVERLNSLLETYKTKIV